MKFDTSEIERKYNLSRGQLNRLVKKSKTEKNPLILLPCGDIVRLLKSQQRMPREFEAYPPAQKSNPADVIKASDAIRAAAMLRAVKQIGRAIAAIQSGLDELSSSLEPLTRAQPITMNLPRIELNIAEKSNKKSHIGRNKKRM